MTRLMSSFTWQKASSYWVDPGVDGTMSVGGSTAISLRHLLVIEEEHRLLENTSTVVHSDVGNMKGKAVETFNHMPSEVRAYGQGLVIADQVPARLSPDVIKSTNLKLIHRLLATDDGGRRVMPWALMRTRSGSSSGSAQGRRSSCTAGSRHQPCSAE